MAESSGFTGLTVEAPVVSSSWLMLRRYTNGEKSSSLTLQGPEEIRATINELRRQLDRIERAERA
jgi:hypothetical protein